MIAGARHSRSRARSFVVVAGFCAMGCLYSPVQSVGLTGDTSTGSTESTGPVTPTSTVGSSSGEGASSSSGPGSTGDPPPEAPTLQLSFSPIKQFEFSWAAAPGALHYQLLERVAAEMDYVQLGADIVGESIALTMPLHLRFGASYVLRACNDGGCTDSGPVEVVDSLAGAIGYFKASNADAGNYFGWSVALAADGDTLAVGALRDDSAATGIDGDQADDTAPSAGAVYVFVRTKDGWSQQAYVKAGNTGQDDYFGRSLALSADGDTLVVGATGESSAVAGEPADDSIPGSGAAYVFVRSNLTWSQQAVLKASNPGGNDAFGASVALSADGDTLAVGARNESSAAKGVDGDQDSNAAIGSGAVYVFVRAGLAWSQQAYVKASNTGANDGFGGSVALSADGATLAVGADGESSAAMGVGGTQNNETAPTSGAVYVFTRADAAWSQQAYVKASNTGTEDRFGGSVALSGNGDTLAVGAAMEDGAGVGVGAEQEDDSAGNAGAAYVFVRVKGAWAQQAYVKASNTGLGELFGGSLALAASGDLLVVGAPQEGSAAIGIGGDQADDVAPLDGAGYVFERIGGTWSQRAYVKAANTGAFDTFGWSVALSADGWTLAVGANGEGSGAVGIGGNQIDDLAGDAGAVYLY